MNSVKNGQSTASTPPAAADSAAKPAATSPRSSPYPSAVNPKTSEAGAVAGMMPLKSMYSAEGAGACDVYRSRNGIMMVKGGMDDEMANSGGMYVNKAALNAQAYGAPACGKKAAGTTSACGSISAMIAKMADSDIAGMAPSERNKVDTFSSRSIARLARNKEQKDEQAMVEKTTADAEKTNEPVKVGAMMDDLKKKTEAESSDIVKTEEQVKRDFLGRPCPPGTYKERSEAAMRPVLKNMMVGGANLSMSLTEAFPSLMPTPMFASLRESQPAAAAAAAAPAAGAAPETGAAAAPVSNLARVDEKMVPVSEAQQQGETAVDAGPTPVVKGFELDMWSIIAIIAASLLVVLLIAGLIYWFVGGGKEGEPKGRVMQTVAAAGGLIGKGVSAVTGAAKGVYEAGKSALSKTAEGIVNVGGKTVDTAANVATGALNVGGKALGTVADTGSALLRADVPGAVEALGGGLKATAQEAVGTVKEAVGDVAGVAGSALGTVGNVAGSAVDAGAAVVGGATDLAKGAVTGTLDVARAATGFESAEPAAAAEPAAEPAAEEASADSSVGLGDIDEAFANAPAAAADATEDLQAKTKDIEQEAAKLLEKTEDASAASSDVAADVATMKDALADTQAAK